MNILFICTGNICRSPMAEYILNHLARERSLDMHSISAGCSDWEAEGFATANAIKAVRELYGIDMAMHRAQHVTSRLADGVDLIVAMEKHHAAYVREMLPDYDARVKLLHEWGYGDKNSGVADPWGQNMQVYKACAQEIYDAVSAALDKYKE